MYFLPDGTALWLSLLSAVGILVGFSTQTISNRRAERKPTIAATSSIRQWILPLVIIAGLGILFFSVQIAWPFLGDGTSYLGFMYNFHESGTLTLQRTATPVLYLLYGIYYIFLKLNNNQGDSFFPFQIVSLLSGLIFTFTTVLFAIRYDGNRWMRALFFIVLISLGGSLLFFGYVETYPLQYALVFVYAYTAYLYLQRKCWMTAVVAGLAFSIAFHLQNILLLPSFVFLLSLRKVDDKMAADKSRIALGLLLAAMPLLLIVYIGSQTGLFGISASDPINPFIPFLPTADFQYSLLHPAHLVDILNEHLLLAVIPLSLLLAAILTDYRRIKWRNPYMLFLLLNFFFLEAFLIGGNLGLGLARDWDISSSLGITIGLLALFIIKEVYVGDRRALALSASTVALCGVAAWVGVNAGEQSSVARYQDLLKRYVPLVEKNIARVSYEHLRKYFQTARMPTDELATIRTMLEIHPTTAEASQGMIVVSNQQNLTKESESDVHTIIDVLQAQNDSLLQLEVIEDIRIAEPHSELATTLGDFFEEYLIYLYNLNRLSLEDALKRCERFIDKHPNLPHGYETYGHLQASFTQAGEMVIPYLQKALALDSLRPRPRFYLAVAFGKAGRRLEALAQFQKALQFDPNSKWGLVEYGIYLTQQPATNEDIPYLEALKDFLAAAIQRPPKSLLQRDRYNEDQKIFNELLARINRRLAEAKAGSS